MIAHHLLLHDQEYHGNPCPKCTHHICLQSIKRTPEQEVSNDTITITLPGSLTVVKQHKHLGLVIDSDLSFSRHVDYICSKVSKAVGYLVSHCSHLPLECIRLFYHCYILPIFLYCSTAWSSLLSKSLMSTLEVHNKRILKVLFCKPSYFPSAELYDMFNTFPISSQADRKLCIVVHSIRLDKAPPHLR